VGVEKAAALLYSEKCAAGFTKARSARSTVRRSRSGRKGGKAVLAWQTDEVGSLRAPRAYGEQRKTPPKSAESALL